MAANIPNNTQQEQEHLAEYQENLYNVTESSRHVLLNKILYGAKKVIDNIDIDFKEFLLDAMPISEFFELYHKYFYELSKTAHTTIMTESINYAFPEGYKNSRLVDLENLQKQLKDLQREIDEFEREHFYIKNGNFITTGEMDEFNSAKPIYFIQSGKKRKILDFSVYLSLKSRYKGGSMEDKNFLIFLDQQGVEKMTSGPDIDSIESADKTPFEINIWPVLPEEYTPEPGLILSEFENEEGELISRGAGTINDTGDIG